MIMENIESSLSLTHGAKCHEETCCEFLNVPYAARSVEDFSDQ